jgi:ketosteroid isomerase-like protein
MSQENLEVARGAYDAFNRRDLDAYLAAFDPEVEFTGRLAEVTGTYRGHPGIREWWDDALSVFPDIQIEVVEIRDLGHVVIAKVRLRGHGAGSDTPVEEYAWQVGAWRDGKIVSVHTYGSEAEALEVAGLPE